MKNLMGNIYSQFLHLVSEGVEPATPAHEAVTQSISPPRWAENFYRYFNSQGFTPSLRTQDDIYQCGYTWAPELTTLDASAE